jgi:hypothetical protein
MSERWKNLLYDIRNHFQNMYCAVVLNKCVVQWIKNCWIGWLVNDYEHFYKHEIKVYHDSAKEEDEWSDIPEHLFVLPW